MSAADRAQTAAAIAAWMDRSEFWRAAFFISDPVFAEQILKHVEMRPDGNQHVVPQALIKAMKGRDEALWVATASGQAGRRKAARVGHEGLVYYDFSDEYGQLLSLEKVWNITESPCGALLPAIARQGFTPTSSESALLNRLVGQLIVRVPAWIDALGASGRQADYAPDEWWLGELPVTMIRVSEDFREHFARDGMLFLLRVPEEVDESFVLSDKPVRLVRTSTGTDVADGVGPGPVELGRSPDLEVRVPLGARVMAQIRLQEGAAGFYGEHWIGDGFVASENDAAVTRARRAIFGRKAAVQGALARTRLADWWQT